MAKRNTRKEAHADEQAFLAAYDASQYPHPSVTVDVALVTVANRALQAALVQRREQPQRERWSLPGGFVQMDESLDDAASRLLASKANIEGLFLEQLYTFGRPDRDPRTRVITVAYYALVPVESLLRRAREGLQLGTLSVPWQGVKGGDVSALSAQGEPLELAFDHAEILGMVVQRLRGKLDYAPLGFELLPPRFTLRQLQTIHETILDKQLNKDSFRRRMLASGLILPTGQLEANVGHRPAELYRFRRRSRRKTD